MVRYHKEKNAIVTLFTHPNSHPYDSGLLIADDKKAVLKWLAKEDERPQWYRNRVNAGLHVISPEFFGVFDIDADQIGTIGENGKTIKVDLDRQLLKPLSGTGRMFCYDSPEYVKDMGTPERYESVCRDFHDGKVRTRSDDLQVVERRVDDGRLDIFVGDVVGVLGKLEDFMDVHILGFHETETLRSVPLRVHIDKEGFLFQCGKTGSQVDGRRGFTHATFLVADCYHFTHSLPRVTKA